MSSKMTKDFETKSKLRGLADGGIARTRGLLGGRGRQIDDIVDGATGSRANNPAPPAPSAPAPAQDPNKNPDGTNKSLIRKLLGFADGGGSQSDYPDGGRVQGPGGPTDDEVGPVMLSDEEYVLPADTVRAIGRDKLDELRLQTHEFADRGKESRLRKVVGLKDGGGAWTVDSDGNVDANRPRQQPGGASSARAPALLPAPTTGTPPRVEVYGGPADVVKPPGAASKLRSTLNSGGVGKLGVLGMAANAVAGGMEEDSTKQYAKRFGISEPVGDGSAGDIAKFAGIRALGAASDMGSALTFGLSDSLYRDKGGADYNQLSSAAGGAGGAYLANKYGGTAGKVLDAAASKLTKGAYKQHLAEKLLGGTAGTVAGGVAGYAAGEAVADGYAPQKTGQTPAPESTTPSAEPPKNETSSALRSDQGAAIEVRPNTYASRRLSEMGVPLDVQNSAPVIDSATGGDNARFMQEGGTDKYQNLGTFGGNGNIYGKADDPARPGRINNFVGVGTGASPSNAYSGSGWDSSIKASPLRSQESSSNAPTHEGNAIEINARYDKLAKDLAGMYGPKGKGNLARQLAALEVNRSAALDADARNMSALRGQDIVAATSRDVANTQANASMYGKDVELSNARASAAESARVKQAEADAKALEKYNSAIENRGKATADAIKGVAETRSAGDKAVEVKNTKVLNSMPGADREGISKMTADEQNAVVNAGLTMNEGIDASRLEGRQLDAALARGAAGGLLGSMVSFGNGKVGAAQKVDKLLGHVPKVGKALSRLRLAENTTKLGPYLGAAIGVGTTPNLQSSGQFDSLKVDPETGTLLEPANSFEQIFETGPKSVLAPGIFGTLYKTENGSYVRDPNLETIAAADQYRSSLRQGR